MIRSLLIENEHPETFYVLRETLFTRVQIKRGDDVFLSGDDDLLRCGHRVEAGEFNFADIVLSPGNKCAD